MMRYNDDVVNKLLNTKKSAAVRNPNEDSGTFCVQIYIQHSGIMLILIACICFDAIRD